MGLCGIPLIGQFVSYCCKCYELGRCFIKISWLVSGILGTLLLVTGGLLSLIMLGSKDFCNLLEDSLADEAFYLKYVDMDPTVRKNLRPCLFDGGDMASELGITEQMTLLDDLGKALDVDTDAFPTSSLAIDDYQDFIVLMEDAKLSDGAPYDMQDNAITCDGGTSHLHCLQDLNDLTFVDGNGYQDEFVFFESQCSASTAGNLFAAGDDNAQKLAADSCHIFDLGDDDYQKDGAFYKGRYDATSETWAADAEALIDQLIAFDTER